MLSAALCNPNINFIYQLIEWRKRTHGLSQGPLLYRIAPHRPHTPTLPPSSSPSPDPPVASSSLPPRFLPRLLDKVDASLLDQRGVFVLRTPNRLFLWIGNCIAKKNEDAMIACGRQLIGVLSAFRIVDWIGLGF